MNWCFFCSVSFDIICWFAAAATLPKVIRLFAQLVCKSNSLLVDSRRPKKPVQNGFSGCMNVNGTILYGARNKHTVLHKMRRNKLCKKEISKYLKKSVSIYGQRATVLQCTRIYIGKQFKPKLVIVLAST